MKNPTPHCPSCGHDVFGFGTTETVREEFTLAKGRRKKAGSDYDLQVDDLMNCIKCGTEIRIPQWVKAMVLS